MERYSIITEKNPREIVLLRGSGCKWRRCRFCDYHLDFSKDEEANYRLNKSVLDQVQGTCGTLEVINSGSFCDLDAKTVVYILQVCERCGIGCVHMECHWKDRLTLAGIKERFAQAGIRVVVKMGVETFDAALRDDVLQKGMEHAAPQDICAYADEVCLLVGLTGQTVRSIAGDIETGLAYFDRVCVNLMTENTTEIKPDRQVLDVFMTELYPRYRDNERVDILLENTDFGVGGSEHDQ